MQRTIILLLFACSSLIGLNAQSRHGKESRFNSYKGLVMAGYQGWFRAPGDAANEGWVHYGKNGKFDHENNTVDFWPDVSDYETTYKTEFKFANGKTCRSLQFC